MKVDVHGVAGVRCPLCGYVMDAHADPRTGVDHASIPDGSFSMCLACGGIGIFDRGRVRQASELELSFIEQNHELVRVAHARMVVISRAGAPGTFVPKAKAS